MFMKAPDMKPAETPEEIVEDFKSVLVYYLTEHCGLTEEQAEQRIKSEKVLGELDKELEFYIGVYSRRVVIASSVPESLIEGLKDPERLLS